MPEPRRELRAEIARLHDEIQRLGLDRAHAWEVIARLRAALEEIDQHRLFMPEAQAYLELKKIARKALANEQSPNLVDNPVRNINDLRR